MARAVGGLEGAAGAGFLPPNRAALAAFHPTSWSRILDGLPSATRPVLARPSGGAISLKLADAAGGLWLHDPTDPAGEAERLTERAAVASADTTIVFGFGAGYAIQSALAAARETASVVAVVLDPGAFLVGMACRDLSSALADRRLTLLVGSLPEIVRGLPRTDERLTVVVHPPLLRAASPALTPLAEMAAELGARQRSFDRLAAVVGSNVSRNLETILSCEPAAALRPIVDGAPVLLVAPGPSLSRDIGALRAADRPLLLAVDTALRPLAVAGVRVDLALTLDPSPGNLAKFDDVDPTIPLVFFEGARPEPVRRHHSRFFACERGGLLDRAHPAFGQHGRYESAGSVVTAALDLLLALGGDPIALVGVDLAPDGSHGHALGAAPRAAVPATRAVPARGGGTIMTTESLWRHRRRLLRRVSGVPQGRIIDATAWGAELTGLPRSQLAEFIARHGASRAGERIETAPGVSSPRVGRIDEEARAAALARLARWTIEPAEPRSTKEDG